MSLFACPAHGSAAWMYSVGLRVFSKEGVWGVGVAGWDLPHVEPAALHHPESSRALYVISSP
jgi:hypothetical protein